MSKWTANWRAGVLERSAEYDEFVRQDHGRKQAEIRRHNWKLDQIQKVKDLRQAQDSAQGKMSRSADGATVTQA